MPRPWISKSGLPLWRSVMVSCSDIVAALIDRYFGAEVVSTVSVCTVLVLSPGNGGVMNRET